jgi:preprotein translocase subunit SecD
MSRRVVALVAILAVAWGGVALAFATDTGPQLGLDLRGGTSVILRAPDGTDDDVLTKAVEVMRSRIAEIGGVSEPEIQVSGDQNVLIQLPGVTNQEQALNVIGQTGQLSFRPVLAAETAENPLDDLFATTTTTQPVEASTTTTSTSTTTTTTTLPGSDPDTGLTVDDDPATPARLASYLDDGTIDEVLVVDGTNLLGEQVEEARPYFDPTENQWVVQLRLDSQGAQAFEDMTRAAAQYTLYVDPQRRIAIVLDGEIMSAPWVTPDEGIAGGSAIISVGSQAEAEDLAVVLRYGSLPISFERLDVKKVSATLGSDSLQGGLIAGVGGLILVALFVVFYYRILGLVTVVGITVFGSLLIAIIGLFGRWPGVTLTLSGVTGIIVAVGITADSYIVFYERIKEEIREGRPLKLAVEEGFARAFRTILTADAVSMMGAFLLYLLAIGPVKVFALSLGIATIIDIFVAFLFTRNAVWLISRGPLGDGGWFSIRGATGTAVKEVPA